MARGGYPEVISVPHIETPIRMGGKPLLFKGLNPAQFGRYFRQGGIDPYYPERPWITSYIDTALEYGGASTINNPGLKKGGLVEEICVAVIHPRVLERGHLRAVNAGEAPFLSMGLRHYQGREHISWVDVMELVMTPKVLETVLHMYNGAHPQDLKAQELVDKIKVMSPVPVKGVKQEMLNQVEKILPPLVQNRVW